MIGTILFEGRRALEARQGCSYRVRHPILTHVALYSELAVRLLCVYSAGDLVVLDHCLVGVRAFLASEQIAEEVALLFLRLFDNLTIFVCRVMISGTLTLLCHTDVLFLVDNIFVEVETDAGSVLKIAIIERVMYVFLLLVIFVPFLFEQISQSALTLIDILGFYGKGG